MPNRDYYFDESERGQFLVQEYQSYISRILSLAGHDDAQSAAARVVGLETMLAEHHWTKVENRDAETGWWASLPTNFGREKFDDQLFVIRPKICFARSFVALGIEVVFVEL